MKKYIKTSILSLSASTILIGCGGSNGSTNTNTGTAYYLDSAVEGVSYKCGIKEGTTDKDGAFKFE